MDDNEKMLLWLTVIPLIVFGIAFMVGNFLYG